MPRATELNERDAKLVQWLNEAYAKEAELEADLTAHITLTTKAPYKKRLQQHLKETREHKRSVERRIKALGGQATTGVSVPGVPKGLGEAAGKAVAAVKGQVGAARAAVTEQAETHVRNAQEELREEHVEIATYLRIQTFAEEVGDRETAQLAKRIARDEQRMAKYLTAEIPRLVKDVVRAEVPREQRGTSGRRRRTSTSTRSRSTSGTSSSRSRSTSGTSSSRSRSTSGGTSSSRSRSTSGGTSRSRTTSGSSGSSGTSSSRGRSSSASGSGSRSGSGSGSRSGSGSGSRSTGTSSRSRTTSGSSRTTSSGSRSRSGGSRSTARNSSRSSS